MDYWDRDGWKDPYSSPYFSERQTAYVRALGLNTPYTPQIIVDGAGELRNSDSDLNETPGKAAAQPKVSVRITSLAVQRDRPGEIRGRAEVDAGGDKQDAGIYAVIALDHAGSHVLRGENSGKNLAHVAVVQEIKKIGNLKKAIALLRNLRSSSSRVWSPQISESSSWSKLQVPAEFWARPCRS